MFLKTNNTDIIKTIDRVNNNYQDITALLQQNQDVAFASYIYISNRCYWLWFNFYLDLKLVHFVNIMITFFSMLIIIEILGLNRLVKL